MSESSYVYALLVAGNIVLALFKLFVFLLLTAFTAAISSLSLAFVSTICFVFYKEFEYVRRTLAVKLADADDAGGRTVLADLERFRLSHQRRCKVDVNSVLEPCNYTFQARHY